jgi:hypothetical protein
VLRFTEPRAEANGNQRSRYVHRPPNSIGSNSLCHLLQLRRTGLFFASSPRPLPGFENTSLLFGFPQLADNLPQAGGSAKSFQRANYRA